MRLTDREARIRAGEAGEAPRLALEQQIAVGDFFDAERFVPVTNAHMMGDMEVMGDAGFAFVESLVKHGAAFAVPVTTNARCVDFEHAAAVRQDPALVAREAALVAHLKKLGALQVDTCINYQTVYQPRFGEHLAWGDTGTVIWANSVTGARTHYEAGPAAVAAGLTGVTPAYGYHLDAQRVGTLRFEVRCALNDYADWGALGGIVGRRTLDYFRVPVLAGVRNAPAGDELKHFGAALASYGSCAMYHMVGVTPEARDETEAFRGAAPEAAHVVADASTPTPRCSSPRTSPTARWPRASATCRPSRTPGGASCPACAGTSWSRRRWRRRSAGRTCSRTPPRSPTSSAAIACTRSCGPPTSAWKPR